MPSNLLLRMEQISKAFPGVQALQSVGFELLEAEMHALVGENGADKSTLIKVLAGIHRGRGFTGSDLVFGFQWSRIGGWCLRYASLEEP